MSLKVIPIFQAKCENRSIVTKQSADPMKWIESALGSNMATASFHFFVDWNVQPSQITGPLWLTRLITAPNPGDIVDSTNEAVLAAFNNSGNIDRFRQLHELATQLNTTAECVLLSEMDARLLNDMSPIWIVEFDSPQEHSLRIKRISLMELSQRIESIRGGPAHIGSKGLTYGTSSIECWLSKTRNIFPGDCDCLIVRDGRPMVLLEMKRHTLSGPIGQNLVSRYNPIPDGRKYDSLFAIKSGIEQAFDSKLPLAVVYYASRFQGYRIQVIEKLNNTLHVIHDSGDKSYNHPVTDRLGGCILEEVFR